MPDQKEALRQRSPLNCNLCSICKYPPFKVPVPYPCRGASNSNPPTGTFRTIFIGTMGFVFD